MQTDAVDALLGSSRGFVVAAAGCGKTEAIARAVARLTTGRELVLTHTHAGVKALRDRLRKFGVPEERFRVDTIAGWCLRYATSFPNLSKLSSERPVSDDWSLVYPAAAATLTIDAIQEVVRNSYSGVFVDEYQDCTLSQHDVVLRLAALLPCRLLGDPLQGIFGFKDRLIDWDRDVASTFEALPPLCVPYRWNNNAALGGRLAELRQALLAGEQFDLRQPPFRWRPLPAAPADQLLAQIRACSDVHGAGGDVVAVRRWAHDCYHVAAKLQGRFTCMEEMDCKDLLSAASRIEAHAGAARCAAVFDFASQCMTGVSTPLAPIRKKLAEGRLPDPSRLKDSRDIARAVLLVAADTTLGSVPELLRLIDAIPNRRLYRRELWREMLRALQLYSGGNGASLREAAWELRNRLRRQGRAVERHTISRTLLIKGLEFAHAVILDAADHDARHFYVAATRPTETLTVCSSEPLIRRVI